MSIPSLLTPVSRMGSFKILRLESVGGTTQEVVLFFPGWRTILKMPHETERTSDHR